MNIENLRDRVIKLTILQLNKEYKHNKFGPDSFDCAGLIWYVYYTLFGMDIFEPNGYGLSTTTKIMTSNSGILTMHNKDKDISSLNKADVLLFHRQSLLDNEPKEDNFYPGHAGIYIGDKKFVQASYVKKKVIISDFDNNPYWQDVLVASKDYITKCKTK